MAWESSKAEVAMSSRKGRKDRKRKRSAGRCIYEHKPLTAYDEGDI